MNKYEAVIGLEIHAELKTGTKMFCFSTNDPDEKHPNINICPVCMGHPGTLPVINEEAVKKTILAGLALGGDIARFSQFDRKNYFYPDLPKGYQISQYKHPLVIGGSLTLEESAQKEVRIQRIHLEEDTGRLIHLTTDNTQLTERSNVKGQMSKVSFIDFNRAGVPLMELVTEPDFRTGEEVREFGEELQKILRATGVSDANMEKGEMRVEVNISLRPEGTKDFGTKVEIKNINSFKFAADAVDYEIKRQTAALERGENITQETRGWNENAGETFSQRSKEEAHDYRYFPEPDLPAMKFSEEFIEKIRRELPELPREKRTRFIKEYDLSQAAAEILTRDRNFAEYFEEVASELRAYATRNTREEQAKKLIDLAVSFFTGEFARLMNEKGGSIVGIKITPENFGKLLALVSEDRISALAAKRALTEMFQSGDDPSDIVERLGLWQVSDADDLEDAARRVIADYPKAVDDYKKGKGASLQFLVGQVMKASGGKANPNAVRDIMEKLVREP